MKIGSLFSGMGGLELGLEWGLGHTQTLWQVEYEEHARLILAQHWPEAERHKDVRHVGSSNLAPVDVVCGGWPCQPHSTAGKRESSNDDRDLWHEFARVIGEIKPRWVVGENVPGVLSSADPAFFRDHPGGFFGRVLRDLAEMGFDAEWTCFPAAAVGAHHLRNRVFLVAWSMAHTSGTGRQEQHAPALSERAGYGSRRSHSGDVADAEQCEGESGHSIDLFGGRESKTEQTGLGSRLPSWAGGEWEQPSPLAAGAQRGIRGVADGRPLRVDRLTRLGNGVVPQQAQVIGEAIKDAEAYWREFGVMPEQIVRPEHLQRVRGVA